MRKYHIALPASLIIALVLGITTMITYQAPTAATAAAAGNEPNSTRDRTSIAKMARELNIRE
ncbi:MAG: hypothetical protein FWG40_03885 [Peptococcaceae bacterium]|nr:hypothetical protein [Peptococcaceae bacterium]